MTSEPERPSEQRGPLAPYEPDRAARARARGLTSARIAGGEDPNLEEGLRQDRYYGRILLIMVIVIVAAGFVLGIAANIITALGSS